MHSYYAQGGAICIQPYGSVFSAIVVQQLPKRPGLYVRAIVVQQLPVFLLASKKTDPQRQTRKDYIWALFFQSREDDEYIYSQPTLRILLPDGEEPTVPVGSDTDTLRITEMQT